MKQSLFDIVYNNITELLEMGGGTYNIRKDYYITWYEPEREDTFIWEYGIELLKGDESVGVWQVEDFYNDFAELFSGDIDYVSQVSQAVVSQINRIEKNSILEFNSNE